MESYTTRQKLMLIKEFVHCFLSGLVMDFFIFITLTIAGWIFPFVQRIINTLGNPLGLLIIAIPFVCAVLGCKDTSRLMKEGNKKAADFIKEFNKHTALFIGHSRNSNDKQYAHLCRTLVYDAYQANSIFKKYAAYCVDPRSTVLRFMTDNNVDRYAYAEETLGGSRVVPNTNLYEEIEKAIFYKT